MMARLKRYRYHSPTCTPLEGRGWLRLKAYVDVIRKYSSHTLQTNGRHCEEEQKNTNSHKT